MLEAGEPVFVKAPVTKAADERLDVSVLIRFTRLDQPQRDPVLNAGSRSAAPLLVKR